jgi:hypothetical protein
LSNAKFAVNNKRGEGYGLIEWNDMPPETGHCFRFSHRSHTLTVEIHITGTVPVHKCERPNRVIGQALA